MEKNSPYSVKSFTSGDSDLRPWNNSFLKLLLHSRSLEKLEALIKGVEEALARLYEFCNSDEVLDLYWKIREVLILLSACCTSARALKTMAEDKKKSGSLKTTRDIGEPLLANGLAFFVSRVNDSSLYLKALAKPCSQMPRDIYSGLSTSLMKIEALSLFLQQEQRRKRSKKKQECKKKR